MCEYDKEDYKNKIMAIPINNCNYCENEKRIEEQENDNIHLSMYGKHLKILGKIPMMHINFGRDVIINYCPMCGRKLGE